MLRLFLLAFTVFITLPLSAKPKAYLDINDSFWSPNPRLVIDGKDLKPGFFGYSDLPEAFASNPQALKYAESFNSYRICANIGLWGGLAAALTYVLASENFDSGTYLGIIGLGLVPGSICGGIAQIKFFRAINSYNGVYDADSIGYEITPSDKGFGLALRF